MYLLSQLWLYLAAAFAAGAILGFGTWRLCQHWTGGARSGSRRITASGSTAVSGQPNPDPDRAVSEGLVVEAETLRSANARLQSELAEERRKHDAEFVQLKAQASAAKPLESELADLRRRLEEARRLADDSARRHAETLKVAAAKAELQLAEARRKRETETADLGRQLDAAINSASPAAKPKRSSPRKRPGPQRLKSPRKGKADDLKLIWGIGATLESKLNQLGIWHFEQIAKWSAEDARVIAAELGEDGVDAITRDKWVERAKRLAAGWRPQNPAGERPD